MIKLPQVEDGSRIGILGGSFDPPHLGHQILALCALALEEIDEVWVIPCADHPFSKKLSPFEHRMHMATIAFDVFGSRVKVISIERELPAPSYSVKTLEAIKVANRTLKLNLLMGSDVYNDLPRWKHPEAIASLSQIVVFQREGSPISGEARSLYAKVYDQFVIPHIKSTDIRESVRSEGQAEFVDQRVLKYIKENGLY